MIVGGTRFPHKIIHKGIWKSPDNETINQIDHILIDARHSSDLIDVRSYRGPNIDSDHFLVMAKIRGRISNLKKDKHMKQDRINVDNLRIETVAREYMRQTDEEMESLEVGENVEELWIKSAPVGNKSGGRLRLRWRDSVNEDARKIGAVNLAMNRNDWLNRLGKVKA
ncbi:uncharacterized protein [Diabrotica undecimpunctata]|uniref:uncharacterized protein n=1 Tax=Diabrotica undecimpunctata TaxID=50387 RepID=UPI003B6407FF